MWVRKLGEGDQKVETLRNEMNKFGSNVQHSDYS